MLFNNLDLAFELEKIKSYDAPVTVEKSTETIDGQDFFALDVMDSTYWYANKDERDEDFINIKKLLK